MAVTMFRTLAVLSLAIASAFGSWEGDLKVRFDLTLFGIGTSAFIELPQSRTTAADKGWVQKLRPDGPEGLALLELWCPNDDYTVCVLIDDTGYIAGMQIALDIDSISNDIYDFEVQGYTKWFTELNGVAKTFWTTQQYYVSAATLQTNAASRIAARDQSKLLQDSAIWVSGFNGQLYEISKDVTTITGEDSDFTQQACIPWMGRHYYYNMTTSTECGQNSLFKWFPLIYDEQLIGIGFIGFLTHASNEGSTEWFETPTASAVKVIVPNGPECLYNLADSPGLVTLHTYFIKHPYALTCVF